MLKLSIAKEWFLKVIFSEISRNYFDTGKDAKGLYKQMQLSKPYYISEGRLLYLKLVLKSQLYNKTCLAHHMFTEKFYVIVRKLDVDHCLTLYYKQRSHSPGKLRKFPHVTGQNQNFHLRWNVSPGHQWQFFIFEFIVASFSKKLDFLKENI